MFISQSKDLVFILYIPRVINDTMCDNIPTNTPLTKLKDPSARLQASPQPYPVLDEPSQ